MNHKDAFIRGLGDGKNFIVNSMYSDIVKQHGLPSNCAFWRLKFHWKLKFSCGICGKGLILTKDNLFKRKWQGCVKCCFFQGNDTTFVFYCHLARNIWNVIFITFGIQPSTSFSHLLSPSHEKYNSNFSGTK